MNEKVRNSFPLIALLLVVASVFWAVARVGAILSLFGDKPDWFTNFHTHRK
jgi:hypothetical protein